VIEAAEWYAKRGLLPIPIPYREKAPKLDGWPGLRIVNGSVAQYFNGAPSNIGLILGDDFGTSDVDLDCAEALATAGALLPETAMIFGRQSKPRSHYFYRCDPPIRSKRYLDPLDKACIVELRCQKSDGTVGLQTVVPPSVHPSGEQIRFDCDGIPANIDAAMLQAAVAKVAAASVLARHWPAEKSGRNQAFIALAGAFARAGWQIDQAVAFHTALYAALWPTGPDLDAAKAEVLATYEKHAGGFQTTGTRTLSDLADKRIIRAAFGWLGIAQPSAPTRDENRYAHSESMGVEDLMANGSISLPELLIEGFLPRRGLVLFGGRPKDGKSWFACQLALSVVTAQPLAGWLRVEQPGRVQLWSLEDGYPLTKDKISKLLAGSHPDGLSDMRVFPELARPILAGGDAILAAALKEHPAELIILDSLFKLTGAKQPTQDISQRDYDVIDRVRRIALDHNCVAVIVMHTKKNSPGGNPIENLLGTSGNTAAADAVCELKRFKDKAKLTVVGRSVPPQDFELSWHAGPQWGWQIDDQGQNNDLDTADEVLAFLDAQGASAPQAIAIALRKSFRSVWSALQRLNAKGKVTRSGRRWELAR